MLTEIDQKNPVVRLSFEFALMVESFCDELRKQQKFELSSQTLLDKLLEIRRLLSSILYSSKKQISLAHT
jgi:hypothetical protein